jgi:TatD DNase family protein
LENVLSASKDWGVTQVINIGTSLKENVEVIEVAENYASVYAAVAIYPHEHRGENITGLIDPLESQAKSSEKVVAIGECGIDVTEWKNQRPLEEQSVLFEAQVKLAQKVNLPLIIHNRNGSEVVLKVLSLYRGTRGVVHCFDATWEVAERFLAMGFYISFSGLITYKSRHDLLEVVKNMPADRYLIETDAPFLLPEPARTESRELGAKRKNEPKYVRMVGQKVAEVRGISLEEVASQTRTNNAHLFGIES